MSEFIQSNTMSFSILVGFLFFILLASRFNHRKMNAVIDKNVAFLCILGSAISGLIIAVFTNVLCHLFL